MLAKLVAIEGLLVGTEDLILKAVPEVFIGQDSEESTLLVNDEAVSSRQLVIRYTPKGLPEGFYVENLGESNPSLINGDEFEKGKLLLLKHGDRLQIGGTLFRFDVQEKTPIKAPKKKRAPQSTSESETYETILGKPSEDTPSITVDFTRLGRLSLNVISGPQGSSSISLDVGHSYTIGNDPKACDIILSDLGVSSKHARLTVVDEDTITIEDLDSRNGVSINGSPIPEEPQPLPLNSPVVLGTTTFVVIDREKTAETIVVQQPVFEEKEEKASREEGALKDEEGGESALEHVEEASQEFGDSQLAHSHKGSAGAPSGAYAGAATGVVAVEKSERFPQMTVAALILILVLGGIGAIIVSSTLTLFESKEVKVQKKDFNALIAEQIKGYTDLTFTFNQATGRLFLLGHVVTPVDRSELLYHLNGLNFITGIDDKVVVDENVWQEMNQVLSLNGDWRGISIHAPKAGLFVVSGYLLTNKQMESLSDYLNLHFPYLDRLRNQVVVEENLYAQIQEILIQKGFEGVKIQLSNGVVVFTGYISADNLDRWLEAVEFIKTKVLGVRSVQNLVVKLAVEQALMDLTDNYRGKITGSSSFDGVSTNVVVNGRILFRGDVLDGMTITGITKHYIYLENNGLKFKIEYTPLS